MNNERVEIIVSPSGEVTIDAIGFKGTACEKQTAGILAAIGTPTKRTLKPEHSQTTIGNQQKATR